MLSKERLWWVKGLLNTGVPAISQGNPWPNNNGWNWNGGNNPPSPNPNIMSELLQSDKFQEFEKFDNYKVSDTLTKKQAEAKIKVWVNKQNSQDKTRYQNDLNEIDRLYTNMMTVINQGVPSLSQEAQKAIKEIERLHADDSLTLRQQREAARNVFLGISPNVRDELLNFERNVVLSFVKQFGNPIIGGKPVFPNLDWENNGNGWDNNNGNNGWNNGNNGWGNNGSGGNNGWGNPNGNQNQGNNGWNNGNVGWGQNNGEKGGKNGWGNPSQENSGWGSPGNNGWGSQNQGNGGWGQNKGGSTGWSQLGGAGSGNGNNPWGQPNQGNNGWNMNAPKVQAAKKA
ncbi:hypothetical protein L596_009600 [Steinernema carpocapsae]|uniref:SXP/RAL-2 family protein Ani s 5-like cation-binding domain-containing protein n=1 Tax=Steinernema carpocapsae TaxID=34508 RepID=A0A4U5PG46_STECR|nr:hypothetical protein L596_009600 [Steinernema carpocapsae]